MANIMEDVHALSKSHRRTFDALFGHPTAHNLERRDTFALFNRLGTVEQLPNDETLIRIGEEHQKLHSSHSKDLSLEEILLLRSFLSRAGSFVKHAQVPPSTVDFLITVDHHEARVYRMDLRPGDPADQVIHPYDPHHFLRHLTHKDQVRQHGERAAEDPSFYERIAHAVVTAVPHGRIVIVGHGKGHSDAAHHLAGWIHVHHPETFQHIACSIAADLSAMTPAQLLVLGRETLASAPE